MLGQADSRVLRRYLDKLSERPAEIAAKMPVPDWAAMETMRVPLENGAPDGGATLSATFGIIEDNQLSVVDDKHRQRKRSEKMPASVVAPITPAVLSWARTQAAVSVPELAKRVDVSEDRVRAWEVGEAYPTVAKLRVIAEMVKQSMALFFAAAPPE